MIRVQAIFQEKNRSPFRIVELLWIGSYADLGIVYDIHQIRGILLFKLRTD